mmetsp:Transcript_45988/g.142509  ORF Transcript_45988/g.142509 Transcript_45988/m.142509 type:complete len:336 (-) Transcript_45988:20-1027(-)
MEPAGRWALGLCFALLNCSLSSAGFIMQRKAHLLNEREGSPEKTFRPLWVVGVFLYVAAAAPDVVAYALAPQVVCSTVACFRLVVVAALAHVVLHERVQGREALGMAACTVGTALTLAFGPRPDDLPAVANVGEFYHPEVVSYLAVSLTVLAALLLLEHAEDFGCRSPGQGVHFLALPLATGLAFGLEKVFNTEVGFLQPPPGLPWGFVEEPQWAAMVVAIGLLGLTDFYLNLRGAQRMPVQVFLPTSFAFATLLQYVQSALIFGEFKDMDAHHRAVSVLGACLSLAGALCIQPPRLGLLGRELLGADEAQEPEGPGELELGRRRQEDAGSDFVE